MWLMKVKKTSGKLSRTDEILPGAGKKTENARRVDFAESISRAERHISQKTLQEMVDDILEQGQKLARKADLRELKKYRELVSLFLDEVLAHSHKFLKHNILDRVGRHKVYAIVKKVDRELELLAEEVMKEEKDNLKILERLDIIKGLILDIEL